MAILTLPYDRQTEYALFTVKETMLNMPGCASGRHGCVAVRVKAEQGVGAVRAYADPYVPEPPYCTHGIRLPASCVLYVSEAQGSLPQGSTTVRTPYAYQPRPCRTYHVPWHLRSRPR